MTRLIRYAAFTKLLFVSGGMLLYSCDGSPALEMRGSAPCPPAAGSVETWCDDAGNCEFRVTSGGVFSCRGDVPADCGSALNQAVQACQAGGFGDGGTDDEDAARPPRPGQLDLTVSRVSWAEVRGRVGWALEVRVANGTSGSASLTPELFTVRTNVGVEVLGTPVTGIVWGGEDVEEGLRCAADLSVPSGSSATCWVAFVPVGDPVSLTYRTGDGREASADVPWCASGIDGYCAGGLDCRETGCDAPCSRDAPTGFCEDGYICEAPGFCRPPPSPCGPEDWSGFCDTGRCWRGSCVVGTVHCGNDEACVEEDGEYVLGPTVCGFSDFHGVGPCPTEGARCDREEQRYVFNRNHPDYDASMWRMFCDELDGEWTP